MRAIRREAALEALVADLDRRIAQAPRLLAARVAASLDKAAAFAFETASVGPEANARQAASGLYYAVAAALLADEGTRLAERGDCRRQLLALLAYLHRLAPRDPLRGESQRVEDAFAQALLPETPVGPEALERILSMLSH
ncbi:MAG: hypothetical protein RML56_06470 [Burkholderiales bacterium]|nr:hypothetical protein [Burkholderiales bacterium]